MIKRRDHQKTVLMFPEVIRRFSHTTTEQVLLGKENGLGGAGRAGGEIKPAGVLVF
jgi:hypothetical protein